MTRHNPEDPTVTLHEGESDTFGERVQATINRVGGATKMAVIAGVSTSVLSKWRRGESDPSRARLVKMARAAGVSVEWLATGEGDPERGAAAPLAQERVDVDLDKLEEVVGGVLGVMRTKRPDLSPKAQARIVRLVYEFYARQGQNMDTNSLNNIIELAAYR